MDGNKTSGVLTLDELIAFNDELIALQNAGLPLPDGLRVAADVRGRVGRYSAEIAERLEAGESLESIIADDSLGFGTFYRSLLKVGFRSGDLGWALATADRVLNRRRRAQESLQLAVIYASVVYVVGAVGLCFLLWTAIPPLIVQFQDIRSQDHFAFQLITAAYACRWGFVIGFVLFGLISIARHFLQRPKQRTSRIARWESTAVQSEVLARLLQRNVSESEAVELAQTMGNIAGRSVELPRVIATVLEHHREDSDLPHRLQTVTRVYREKADVYSVAKAGSPMLISAAVGGCLAASYVLLVFVPWYKLLTELARAI
ncbi:MAG: type II secretion system F family protein [Pirellulaceae bacterium]